MDRGQQHCQMMTQTNCHTDYQSDSSFVPDDLRLQLERELDNADAAQRSMMDERVIVTDYYDNPVSSGSKKESESTT